MNILKRILRKEIKQPPHDRSHIPKDMSPLEYFMTMMIPIVRKDGAHLLHAIALGREPKDNEEAEHIDFYFIILSKYKELDPDLALKILNHIETIRERILKQQIKIIKRDLKDADINNQFYT